MVRQRGEGGMRTTATHVTGRVLQEIESMSIEVGTCRSIGKIVRNRADYSMLLSSCLFSYCDSIDYRTEICAGVE